MARNFEDSVTFINSMQSIAWEQAHIFGSFPVTQSSINFVETYQDELDIEIFDEEHRSVPIRNCNQYSSLQIKFLPTRTEVSFIASDMNDYLSFFSFRHKAAQNIYLTNGRHISRNNQTTSELIAKYYQIIKLLNLIEDVSEHTSPNGSEKDIVLFNGSDKTTISTNYSAESLNRSDITEDEVESIIQSISSSPHKETKASLFKKVLIDLTQGTEKNRRLETLISGVSEIKQKFTSNYEIFLNDFSFDSEKEKLDEQKQCYILKTNDILSGIHGKLFAVPASVVIVAGQMKAQGTVGYSLTNTIILAGAFLFALFMWMLTSNQLHSLTALRNDFNSKKNRIRTELKNSLFSEIKTSFTDIENRMSYQRNMIRLIDILVLLSLLMSLGIYEYHCMLIASWL